MKTSDFLTLLAVSASVTVMFSYLVYYGVMTEVRSMIEENNVQSTEETETVSIIDYPYLDEYNTDSQSCNHHVKVSELFKSATSIVLNGTDTINILYATDDYHTMLEIDEIANMHITINHNLNDYRKADSSGAYCMLSDEVYYIDDTGEIVTLDMFHPIAFVEDSIDSAKITTKYAMNMMDLTDVCPITFDKNTGKYYADYAECIDIGIIDKHTHYVVDMTE